MDSAVSRSIVPARPDVGNMNSLLTDIYVRYIAIKSEDFQLYYRVFTEVFRELHTKMKAVDKYYDRYSSNVQFAGSHYDGLRINKPDEFDMDIVIGLPVNMHKDRYDLEESDIVIEQKEPGFVQLRAGTQYQNILIRDGADREINKTAYEWLDGRNYILRNRFIDWFIRVGNKALNEFRTKDSKPACRVDGIWYTIDTSSHGLAWTLRITARDFKLDVDIVPALKFPEERWLTGKSYRKIPAKCRRDYWMVVPKPNKSGHTYHDEQRSWRVSLQDQEKQLLNNTNHLRQVVRLLKKFRDVQGMDRISSYDIKTLFFWEIVEKESTDPLFWQKNDVATLFKQMVGKFYAALDNEKIPYFWNRNYNQIGHLSEQDLYHYRSKIKELSNILKSSDHHFNYTWITRFLLTTDEQIQYQRLLY